MIDAENIYETGLEALQSLEKCGLTLALAESCTGGMIASALVAFPGASKHFAGAVVAYSNDVKVRLLSVSPGTLAASGAVSEECAAEMSAGVRAAAGTDAGLAVTGIAGPEGGSAGKPVGTVCFSVCSEGLALSETMLFAGSRNDIRMKSAVHALRMLVRFIEDYHSSGLC